MSSALQPILDTFLDGRTKGYPQGREPLHLGDVGFQRRQLRLPRGVSHPCTTFDKWQLIFVVDDAYHVEDAIRTFF